MTKFKKMINKIKILDISNKCDKYRKNFILRGLLGQFKKNQKLHLIYIYIYDTFLKRRDKL